jgi:ABC-type uncharacterized transport system permease subunit
MDDMLELMIFQMTTLLAAMWLIPTTIGMILNRYGLPIMPLVILLFGATAWARLKAQPKVELPSVATAG